MEHIDLEEVARLNEQSKRLVDPAMDDKVIRAIRLAKPGLWGIQFPDLLEEAGISIPSIYAIPSAEAMREELEVDSTKLLARSIIEDMRDESKLTVEHTITYLKSSTEDLQALYTQALKTVSLSPGFPQLSIEELIGGEEKVREVFESKEVRAARLLLAALGYKVSYRVYAVNHAGVIGCDMVVSASA